MLIFFCWCWGYLRVRNGWEHACTCAVSSKLTLSAYRGWVYKWLLILKKCNKHHNYKYDVLIIFMDYDIFVRIFVNQCFFTAKDIAAFQNMLVRFKLIDNKQDNDKIWHKDCKQESLTLLSICWLGMLRRTKFEWHNKYFKLSC